MATADFTTPPVSEGYYCEGPCGARASDASPVYRIGIGFYTHYYCADCLNSRLNNEDGSRECSNCGETAYYCSAGCASAEGDEYRSSCTWCGDDAYYCSATCAIADGNAPECTECDATVPDAGHCPAHRPAQTLAHAAASNVVLPDATDEDGNVAIDGITFQF